MTSLKSVLKKWKKNKDENSRILIEDSLKHIHDCEYRGVTCTPQSTAGAIGISFDKAAKLISKLEKMNLVKTESGRLELTLEGRSYALRIIRIHRLWERYLADETSMTEIEWHQNAESKEHQLSDEEVELLSAKLGNPLTDPHGDPIPTAEGDIPEQYGIPLNELKTGRFAKIIHLEDEPHAIYSQLVAEGLYPGMIIQMLEVSNERVKFDAAGETAILAPSFAAHVTVHPVKEEEITKEKYSTLSILNIGESAKIAGVANSCRGQQRRRLLDLGFVPGSKIEVEMQSIGKDPIAYRVRGSVVALRKKQSDQIFIKDIETEK